MSRTYVGLSMCILKSLQLEVLIRGSLNLQQNLYGGMIQIQTRKVLSLSTSNSIL